MFCNFTIHFNYSIHFTFIGFLGRQTVFSRAVNGNLMYNWTSFLVCFRSTDGSRKINRSISLRATVSECCNWLHAPEYCKLTSRIGTLRQSSRNINRNVRAGYRNNIQQLTSRSEYCRLTSRIGTLRLFSRNINRNVRLRATVTIFCITSLSQTVNRTPVLYCIDFGMTDNRISVLLYCNDEFLRLISLLLDNLLNLLSCCFVSVYRVGKYWFASHLDYSTASNNNNVSRGTDIPTCVGFLLRLTHVDFLWPMKYSFVRFHVVIDTHACNV